MISKFCLLKCFFFFTFLVKTALASEIRLVFSNKTPINISVMFEKDDVLLDSSIFEAHNGKVLVLKSPLKGIHQLSFDKKRSFYLYIKDKADLEVKVDLEKGKFEVINSFESQQLNTIFENWQREVAILKTLKEPTFEHLDKAFDNLVLEILKTQNPEIIDWASVFLIDLEKDPSNYILSLENFIDFEQIVKEKYPSYKFNKLKVNFAIRKDNQSGYYWKY